MILIMHSDRDFGRNKEEWKDWWERYGDELEWDEESDKFKS